MIRNITFINSKISSLQIRNKIPVQLISEGNDNELDIISLVANGDNINKNIVILDGNFGESQLDVKSSCTLQSNPTFICNTPINVSINNSEPIILLGDFLYSKGIKILSPSIIINGSQIQLKNLNIVINYDKFDETNCNIIGDFSLCKFYIESSANITLDGSIGSTILEMGISDVTLDLLPGSIIYDMKAKSQISVSGDSYSLDKLIANTSEGLENIDLNYNTFVIDSIDGKAIISLKLNNYGNYKISASIIENTTEVALDNPIEIEVQ